MPAVAAQPVQPQHSLVVAIPGERARTLVIQRKDTLYTMAESQSGAARGYTPLKHDVQKRSSGRPVAAIIPSYER